MFRTLKDISAVLGFIPQVVRSYASPMKAALNQINVNRFYRMMAKDGGGVVEFITTTHSDQKIAAVARDFEAMLEHPLCKKYLRRTPALYLDKGDKMLGSVASPSVMTTKTILLPQTSLENLSLPEIKAVLAHELGHVLRQDLHPRRGLGLLYRGSRYAEDMADEIAVILSGDVKAAQSALEKLMYNIKTSTNDTGFSLVGKLRKWLVGRAEKNGTAIYSSLSERKMNMQSVGEQLETPQGRSFVEAEMARRLEIEHRKLFPHLYDRPNIPNR